MVPIIRAGSHGSQTIAIIVAQQVFLFFCDSSSRELPLLEVRCRSFMSNRVLSGVVFFGVSEYGISET